MNPKLYTILYVGALLISAAIGVASIKPKPEPVQVKTVTQIVKVPMTHKEQRAYEDSTLQGCTQVPDKNDEVVGFKCGKTDITIPETSLEHLLMEYYHPDCCYG